MSPVPGSTTETPSTPPVFGWQTVPTPTPAPVAPRPAPTHPNRPAGASPPSVAQPAAIPGAGTAPVTVPPVSGPATATGHAGPGPQRSGGRRSTSLVATGAFLLGGLVGVGGFGAGRYLADGRAASDGPAVSTPATAVAVESPDPAAGSAGSGAVPTTALEPAAEVARILGPSVVQVETNRGQGSGVVYADDLLLTNHHVIDGADRVRIRTANGRVFDVEVLGSDPRNDIAVLSAPGSNLPVAAIGSSAALEPGQLTVAIGSPFQLQQTVTAGIVSSTNRPVPNQAGGVSAMIQTDAPINPGNSGGALANRAGELVGINASIRTDGTGNSNVGIGFAVPIDTAIEVAGRIVGGQSLEPAVLGVRGEPQDDGVGVPVSEVFEGSGAEAAGLQPGDRVLTIDGVPVTSIGELTGLVQSHFSGDSVELEVQRGSSTIILEAELS